MVDAMLSPSICTRLLIEVPLYIRPAIAGKKTKLQDMLGVIIELDLVISFSFKKTPIIEYIQTTQRLATVASLSSFLISL